MSIAPPWEVLQWKYILIIKVILCAKSSYTSNTVQSSSLQHLPSPLSQSHLRHVLSAKSSPHVRATSKYIHHKAILHTRAKFASPSALYYTTLLPLSERARFKFKFSRLSSGSIRACIYGYVSGSRLFAIPSISTPDSRTYETCSTFLRCDLACIVPARVYLCVARILSSTVEWMCFGYGLCFEIFGWGTCLLDTAVC